MTILKCSCTSRYQDWLYGDGMRAHNDTATHDPQEYRCTVCGTTRTKRSKEKAK